MTSSKKFFDENGYVCLIDALPKKECEELTKYMFELYDKGKLVKDDQCPLSDAVYGDPVFDDLLRKFAEPIGQNIGRKLLPTYSYARIYRKGEILKRHVDRPSCEFSATLTLGFDNEPVWPIYFDEKKEAKIDLRVGELAVYRGCDIVHWRTAFKGEWHVQVFLHYVDAIGPYADKVFDGRGRLGDQKNSDIRNNAVDSNQKGNYNNTGPDIEIRRPIYNGVIIPQSDLSFPGYISFNSEFYPELMFTQEECDEIVKYSKNKYPATASVGGGGDGRVARQIRSASIYDIEPTKDSQWLFDKLGRLVFIANTLHFKYDIVGMAHGLQLIEYNLEQDIPGHYEWHVDAGPGTVNTRKISFVAQLSNPSDYEGCELQVNNYCNLLVANKERGSIHMFPSYMPHAVTPITKGKRYSLVIWIEGPTHFK